jgi:uncharacterized DUF497 family protein
MPSDYFDWDDDNIGHIAEHGVTPEEAEQLLLGDPLDWAFDLEAYPEKRWSYVGETDKGRILFVVITMRAEKIRVITAFDAGKQDQRIYLETKAGQQ